MTTASSSRLDEVDVRRSATVRRVRGGNEGSSVRGERIGASPSSRFDALRGDARGSSSSDLPKKKKKKKRKKKKNHKHNYPEMNGDDLFGDDLFKADPLGDVPGGEDGAESRPPVVVLRGGKGGKPRSIRPERLKTAKIPFRCEISFHSTRNLELSFTTCHFILLQYCSIAPHRLLRLLLPKSIYQSKAECLSQRPIAFQPKSTHQLPFDTRSIEIHKMQWLV
jgi:hypothetical protein